MSDPTPSFPTFPHNFQSDEEKELFLIAWAHFCSMAPITEKETEPATQFLFMACADFFSLGMEIQQQITLANSGQNVPTTKPE
jgi:hypothetical protein